MPFQAHSPYRTGLFLNIFIIVFNPHVMGFFRLLLSFCRDLDYICDPMTIEYHIYRTVARCLASQEFSYEDKPGHAARLMCYRRVVRVLWNDLSSATGIEASSHKNETMTKLTHSPSAEKRACDKRKCVRVGWNALPAKWKRACDKRKCVRASWNDRFAKWKCDRDKWKREHSNWNERCTNRKRGCDKWKGDRAKWNGLLDKWKRGHSTWNDRRAKRKTALCPLCSLRLRMPDRNQVRKRVDSHSTMATLCSPGPSAAAIDLQLLPLRPRGRRPGRRSVHYAAKAALGSRNTLKPAERS